MKNIRRVCLFVLTNFLIIATLSLAMSILGVQPYLEAQGINYRSLLAFCILWGFGGALVSLAMSKVMAKWMMGVKLIDPQTNDFEHKRLVTKVHRLARKAGIEKMPEVGIYDADDLNAFATGSTKNQSLIAVSSSLLQHMNDEELEGVIAHEIAHIANGDMVTMTLIQGVLNVFVMFIARVAGFIASQFVAEDKKYMVQFGVVFVLEISLGVLAMIVVSYYSRLREYRADRGGASLATRESMISALERLKVNQMVSPEDSQPAFASLKISGISGGLTKHFSTHPLLDDRILALKLFR